MGKHREGCGCPFHRGHPREHSSEATRKATSAAVRRRWQDPVYRQRVISALRAVMPHCAGCSHPGASNGMWKGGPLNPNGPGWKAARRKVWARDKVCRACGGPPSLKRRLDVHHIMPRRDGGTNDESNLLGLHHGCHMKVEAGRLKVSGKVPII
jgi:5-methylcytosine-specific restriction endonuclease McrA